MKFLQEMKCPFPLWFDGYEVALPGIIDEVFSPVIFENRSQPSAILYLFEQLSTGLLVGGSILHSPGVDILKLLPRAGSLLMLTKEQTTHTSSGIIQRS